MPDEKKDKSEQGNTLPPQKPLVEPSQANIPIPVWEKIGYDTLNAKRQQFIELSKQLHVNGSSVDGKDVDIVDFFRSGVYKADEILNITGRDNINLVYDPAKIDALNVSNEEKNAIKNYADKTFMDIKTGNVVLSGTKYFPWNEFTQHLNLGKGLEYAYGRSLKYADPTTFKIGDNIALPVYHEDEIASSNFGVTKTGKVITPAQMEQEESNGKYFKREMLLDPITNEHLYLLREVDDFEWVDPSELKSVWGDRQVIPSSYASSFARGFMQDMVGSTVKGVGFVAGLMGDMFSSNGQSGLKRFEWKTSLYGGSFNHIDVMEEAGMFDNWYSALNKSGVALSQTAKVVSTAYIGGGSALLLGGSKAVANITGRTLATTLLSAGAGGDTKAGLMAQGVSAKDATLTGLAVAGTAAVVETILGPDAIFEPMKNKYFHTQLANKLKDVIGNDFIKSAGDQTKKRAILNAVNRGIAWTDKYAATRAIYATAVETAEEGIEQVFNNKTFSLVNDIEKQKALDELNEMSRGNLSPVTYGDYTVGYSYEDKNGSVRYVTDDKFNNLKQIAARQGVYGPEAFEFDLAEMLVTMAVSVGPMSFATFYGSERNEMKKMNTFFKDGDIYDMAYMMATGKLSEKDVDDALKQLHKQNYLLNVSAKMNDSGALEFNESTKENYGYYKQSLMNELNTLVSVIKENGLSTGSTLRTMSDVNSMNRYVLHGALGGALMAKEANDALNSINNGEAIKGGRFVHEGMSVEEIQELRDKGTQQMNFFAKESGKVIELGMRSEKRNVSEAVSSYYNHHNMIARNVSNNLYMKMVHDAMRDNPKATEEQITKIIKSKLAEMPNGFLDKGIHEFIEGLPNKTNYDILSMFNKNKDEIEQRRVELEKIRVEARKNEYEQAKSSTADVDRFTEDISNLLNKYGEWKGKKEKTSEKKGKLEEEVKALSTREDEESKLTSKEKEREYENTVKELDAIDKELSELGNNIKDKIFEADNINGIAYLNDAVQKANEIIQRASEEVDEAQGIADIISFGNVFDVKGYQFEEDVMTGYTLSPDEVNELHVEAIKQHFFKPEELALYTKMEGMMQEQVSRLLNGESVENEIPLSVEEAAILNQMKGSLDKFKEYTFYNIGYFQDFIESNYSEKSDKEIEDEKNKAGKNKTLKDSYRKIEERRQYSELSNRTRIPRALKNDIYRFTNNIEMFMDIAVANTSDEYLEKVKTRLRTRLAHLHLIDITIQTLLLSEEYHDMLLDDRLREYAEKVNLEFGKSIDAINTYLGLDSLPAEKHEYLNSLVKSVDTLNAEQLSEINRLLNAVEKAYVDFGSQFYEKHSGTLQDVTSNDGTVQKGLLSRLDELQQKMVKDGLPQGLNRNEWGYTQATMEIVSLNNDESDYYYVKDADGRSYLKNKKTGEELGDNQLYYIYLHNMVFLLGSIDLNEFYKNLREDISNRKKGELIPTFEQQQAIAMTLAHLINPDTSMYVNHLPENNGIIDVKKHVMNSYYWNNMMYIFGNAGSGKTAVITSMAIRMYNRMKNTERPLKVLVMATSKEVAMLSKDSMKDDAEVDVTTYNDVVRNKIDVNGYDMVIADEATILDLEFYEKVKDKFKNYKGAVIALGDDNQTIPTGSLPRVKLGGRKTIRIFEQHRSKIFIIRDIQEAFIKILSKGKTSPLPDGQYTVRNGKTYGLRYVQTENEVMDEYEKDTNPDKILIVETESEAERLREKYGTANIYSMEYDDEKENSLCVSGITVNRVYVAYSIDRYYAESLNTSKIVKKLLTSASRAREYIVIPYSHGRSNMVSILPGLEMYLAEVANGIDTTVEKDEQVERINAIVHDDKTVNEKEKKDAEIVNEQQDKQGKEITVAEREDEKTVKASTLFRRMAIKSMNGLRSVLGKIETVIYEMTTITSEKESLEKIDSDAKVNSDASLKMMYIYRLMREINMAYHEKVDFKVNDIYNFTMSFFEEYGEELKEYGLSEKMMLAIGYRLYENPLFMEMVSDDATFNGVVLNNIVSVDGKKMLQQKGLHGLRVIGQIDGKPVINIQRVQYVLKDEYGNRLAKLLGDIQEGKQGSLERLITLYRGENLEKEDEILSVLTQILLDDIASSISVIGDRASLGQYEIFLTNIVTVDNTLRTFGKFSIDIAALRPTIDMIISGNANQYRYSVSERGTEIADRYPTNDEIKTYEKQYGLRFHRNGILYVDGKYAGIVDEVFIRFEDGVQSLYILTKNGKEYPVSNNHGMAIRLNRYENNAGNETEASLKRNGKQYNGTYYRPKALENDDNYNRYLEIRSKLYSHMIKQESVRLKRTYHENYEVISNINGKRKRITYPVFITYALEESFLDNASANGIISKEEYNFFTKHNVVAIEGVGTMVNVFDVKGLKDKHIGVYSINDVEQDVDVKEFLSKPSTFYTSENVKASLAELRKILNAKYPGNEHFINYAIWQLTFIVENKYGLPVSNAYVSYEMMAGPHVLPVSGNEGIDFNTLPTLNEVIENNPDLDYDYDIEVSYSNVTAVTNTSESPKGYPIFYLRINIGGKAVKVRLLSPRMSQLSEASKSEFFRLLFDEIRKKQEDKTLSQDEGERKGSVALLIDKVLTVNSQLIYQWVNDSKNNKSVLDVIEKLIKYNNKYHGFVFRNSSYVNGVLDTYYNFLEENRGIIEKLFTDADVYLPAMFLNETLNSEMVDFTANQVKVVAGTENGRILGVNGMITSWTDDKELRPSVDEEVLRDEQNGEQDDDRNEQSIEDVLDDLYEKPYDSKVNRITVSIDEALRLIEDVLGKEYLSRMPVQFIENLRNPHTMERVMGLVVNASIRLDTVNGRVYYEALYHEAAHVVYEYILDEESKKKIANEIRKIYGNSINVSEKIAELMENPKVYQSGTLLGNIIDFIKYLLYRINLYRYDIQSFGRAFIKGYFSGANIQPGVKGMDITLNKKYDVNVDRLLDIFTDMNELSVIVNNMVTTKLRSKIPINTFTNRKELESINTAIQVLYNNLSLEEQLKRGKINSAYKGLTVEQFENIPIPIDGKIKPLKELDRYDYGWLKEDIKANAEYIKLYIIYHTSKPYVRNALIGMALPGIDVKKVLKSKNARMGKGQSVIRSDNSNEMKSIKDNLSPFIKFILSSIPYYNNIRLTGDGARLDVDYASHTGYLDADITHNILIEVGLETTRLEEVKGLEPIPAFTEALRNVISSSRGIRRNTALSLLAEIGDIPIRRYIGKGNLDVSGPNYETKMRYLTEEMEFDNRNKFPTGILGMFTRINDEQIERELKANGRYDYVKNKGEYNLTTFIIPMINMYRSIYARNIVDVVYDKGFYRIQTNEIVGHKSMRNRIRQRINNRVYKEGIVKDDLYNQLSSQFRLKDGNIEVYENGKWNTFIYRMGGFNYTDTLSDNILSLLKMIGIPLSVTDEKYINATIGEGVNVRDRIGKNAVLSEELYSVILGLYVNHEIGEYVSGLEGILDRLNNEENDEDEIKRLNEELEKTIVKIKEVKHGTKQEGLQLQKETTYMLLSQIYGKLNYKLEPIETSTTLGRNNVENHRNELSIPIVWDNVRLLDELAQIKYNSYGRDTNLTFYNGEGNMVQRYVTTSHITSLLGSNAVKLRSIIGKFANGMYDKYMVITRSKNGGKQESMVLSSFAENSSGVVVKSSHALKVLGLYDMDTFINSLFGISYNRVAKKEVHKALIESGFVQRLSSSENTFYAMLSPYSDKTNSRIVEIDHLNMLQVKRSGGNVSIDMNKSLLVEHIGRNVLYINNIHEARKKVVVDLLNSYAAMVGINVELNSKSSIENIANAFERLSAYGSFKKYMRKNAIANLDYRKDGDRIVPGNVITLTNPMGLYTYSYVKEFMGLMSKEGNDTIDKLYQLTKKHFLPAYKQFARTLVNDDYEMPKSYLTGFIGEKVRMAEKKVIHEYIDGLKNTRGNSHVNERVEILKHIYLDDMTLKNALDSYFSNEEETDDGLRSKLKSLIHDDMENVRMIAGNMISEKGLTDGDIYQYIDVENDMVWNSIYESYFFMTHIVDFDISKFTRGTYLFYKDVSDYIKRGAGESAPAIKPTVNVRKGLPEKMNVLVVDFKGGSHPQGYHGYTQLHDPELKANGEGFLNPIASAMMKVSFGSEYGPVGETMVKSVVHYHDYQTGNTIYMKQAMRQITLSSIRISEMDWKLFKLMNKRIWDMQLMDSKTVGQHFEELRNGQSIYDFNYIVSKTVDLLNETGRSGWIYLQAIDPSAVKTGLTAVYDMEDIDTLLNSETDIDALITTMKANGQITYTNEKGEICAGDGYVFNDIGKDTKWELVADLQGMPKHKDGGVDVTFTRKGVYMVKGDKMIKPKNGLYAGKKELTDNSKNI